MIMSNKKDERPKFYYIYKIYFLCGFPSGRYYIGKRTYRGYEINNDQYTGSGNFCKSYFNKYGEISGVTYIKEIIEINPSNKINLEREKILIGNLWKTDPLCMNMMPGGIGSKERKGRIPTPEEIAKRIESFKKSKSFHKKRSPFTGESKQKISKALMGNKNGLGRIISEKTKQKIREKTGKLVYQFDLDGNFISKYESIHEAAKAVNGYPINISNCCNNKKGWLSYKKFVWTFNPKKKLKKYVNTHNKQVQQLDLSGNIINTFESIREASIKTKINAGGISQVANKKHGYVTAGGYKWKYVK